jgi:flagellar basal-body rod protein FlgG
MFSAPGGGQDLTGRTRVLNGYLEASNADMIGQMTEMMSSQRALQSAAQMLKMYDQVLSKASSDVGRL